MSSHADSMNRYLVWTGLRGFLRHTTFSAQTEAVPDKPGQADHPIIYCLPEGSKCNKIIKNMSSGIKLPKFKSWIYLK